MEKRYIEVLRRGLLLINAITDYPQERELLIKSISVLKDAMRRYMDEPLGNYEETYKLLGRTNSLITHIEQETTLEEVNQLESFMTFIESEEVESLTTLFGPESVEIIWPVLTENQPKGVSNDQHFYQSLC